MKLLNLNILIVVFATFFALPSSEAQTEDVLKIKLQLNQPSFYVKKGFISAHYEASCEPGLPSQIMMIAEPIVFWDGYDYEVLERTVPLSVEGSCVHEIKLIKIEFGGDTSKSAAIQLVVNNGQRGLPVAQDSNLLRGGRWNGNQEILVLKDDIHQSNELSIGVNPASDYPNGILLIY